MRHTLWKMPLLVFRQSEPTKPAPCDARQRQDNLSHGKTEVSVPSPRGPSCSLSLSRLPLPTSATLLHNPLPLPWLQKFHEQAAATRTSLHCKVNVRKERLWNPLSKSGKLKLENNVREMAVYALTGFKVPSRIIDSGQGYLRQEICSSGLTGV